MARCRACAEPIVWAKTADGKTMPVDAEPNPRGTLILTRTIDDHATVRMATAGDPQGLRWMSHFASCPAASKFRRKPSKTSPGGNAPVTESGKGAAR